METLIWNGDTETIHSNVRQGKRAYVIAGVAVSGLVILLIAYLGYTFWK